MRAWTLPRYGGPEVLELVELPDPVAGDGQVLVRVTAIGVNPFEVKQRRGDLAGSMRLDLPAVIGSEIAGVVEAIGHGTDDDADAGGATAGALAVGDLVAGTAARAYAELVAVRATRLARVPAGAAATHAAALPTGVTTADGALDALGVGAGDTVVVNGASGGVGQIAVQLLVQRGARVIGTGGAGSRDRIAALGAEPVVYGDGVVGRVRAAAPDGVDAVLDIAGHGFLDAAVELRGGVSRIVTIADSEGAERLGVPFFSAQSVRRPVGERIAPALAQLADGRLRVEVAGTYPFAELPAAHERVERGHPGGKIVVTVP
jgi:NADPH:quinone reductase-like Zn-dependent oxidoreductase